MRILKQLLKRKVDILAAIIILAIFLYLSIRGIKISIKTMSNLDKKASEYNNSFKTIKSENIIIYYHPNIEPAIKQINAYLEQAEVDTTKLFPKVKQKTLTIKFDYDEKVFRELYPDRMDSQGFYLRNANTIDILVQDCYSDILSLSAASARFKDTVLHEYSHYKLKDYVEYNNVLFDNIPAWFNEGIACYIGCEGANEADEPKAITPFKELADADEWTECSNETNGDVYVQAHYAVSELILTKGETVIKEILLKTKYLSFEAAFKEVTGLSLEGFEKELDADRKNGWKKYRKLIPLYKSQNTDSIRIESLEDYIEYNPDNLKAYLDLSTLYSAAGNFEKAKTILFSIQGLRGK